MKKILLVFILFILFFNIQPIFAKRVDAYFADGRTCIDCKYKLNKQGYVSKIWAGKIVYYDEKINPVTDVQLDFKTAEQRHLDKTLFGLQMLQQFKQNVHENLNQPQYQPQMIPMQGTKAPTRTNCYSSFGQVNCTSY